MHVVKYEGKVGETNFDTTSCICIQLGQTLIWNFVGESVCVVIGKRFDEHKQETTTTNSGPQINNAEY